MIGIESVTLSEAQYLLQRPQEQINRAIDRGEVEKFIEVVVERAQPKTAKRTPVKAKTGSRRRQTSRTMEFVPAATVRRRVRKLKAPELLYLVLVESIEQDLTPQGRKRLYVAIKQQPAGATVVNVGSLQIHTKVALKELTKRYEALKALRLGIVENAMGEPFFKGSDIPVYAVATLARGQGVEEVLEDYPSLTPAKVAKAIDYAIAYPKKGRPYPTQSLKRAAAALVAAGVFDLPPGMRPARQRLSDAVSARRECHS